MEQEIDDVSNIHNRFSLTLVNPSSKYFSLVVSMVVASVTVLAVYFGYLSNLGFEENWYRLPIVLGVLAITQLLDSRFAKKKEYSKSLHSSLFWKYVMDCHTFDGNTFKYCFIKRFRIIFHYFWIITFCKFQNRNLHYSSWSKSQKSIGPFVSFNH